MDKKMIKNFIKQIQKNQKIAIWGMGFSGTLIKSEIDIFRKDLKIKYLVDSFKEGLFENMEIISPKQLGEIKNEIDLLILATTKNLHENMILLEFLGIKYINISLELERYCRNSAKLKNFKTKIEEVTKIFNKKEQNLYKMIWDYRLGNPDKLKHYVFKKYGIKSPEPIFNYNYHYQEFINKDNIKNIIDGGVFNGIHLFTFKKYFKNLKNIYAFEPMYDTFKNDIYDYYLKDFSELKIIPLGLWNKDEELSFINKSAGSRIVNSDNRDKNLTTIKTTSIDNYKEKNHLGKIDYIKLDIEGAELKCLQGAEKTILADRPQLAISIYHSEEDLVEIPLYMYNLLKDKNYTFHLGHYSPLSFETVLYVIPNELVK